MIDGRAAGDGPSLRARLVSAPALLLVGVLIVIAVTVAGRSDLLVMLLSPPMPARLLLGIAALVLAIAVVLAAADRIHADREPQGLIRAVRLLFVAVGLLSAAAGWLIGSPVPVVAGLVIVAIDLLETSFLLIVTAGRGRAEGGDGQDRPDDEPRVDAPDDSGRDSGGQDLAIR